VSSASTPARTEVADFLLQKHQLHSISSPPWPSINYGHHLRHRHFNTRLRISCFKIINVHSLPQLLTFQQLAAIKNLHSMPSINLSPDTPVISTNLSPSSELLLNKQEQHIPFRFLDLSAELRNHIYSYAFQGQPSSRRQSFWLPTSTQEGHCDHVIIRYPREVNSNLLLCCKQIYQEAHSLPFKLSTFFLVLGDFDDSFQGILPWPILSHIQHVNVEVNIHGGNSLTAVVDWLNSQSHFKIHKLDVWFGRKV
jgi:hypothetical protein